MFFFYFLAMLIKILPRCTCILIGGILHLLGHLSKDILYYLPFFMRPCVSVQIYFLLGSLKKNMPYFIVGEKNQCRMG